ETVYGLGADAFNEKAIKKIFELKKRPANNPLIIHVSDFSEVQKVAILPDIGKQRDNLFKIARLWPGPLTIILKKHPDVSDLICADQDTVGIRIPNHPFALALLKAANCPIVAPSANISNSVSPTKAKHVEEAFGDDLQMILDGGDCKYGLESTVISLVEKIPTIYRPGSITKEQIEEVLNEEVVYNTKEKEKKVSPGLSEKHYCPKTKLVFAKNSSIENIQDFENVGRIRFKTFDSSDVFNNYPFSFDISLSDKGDLEEIAKNLFSALHTADSHNLDIILIDDCDNKGVGAAIMNRLNRAITS
ncbi:UNVERIFIED_CONTAM: hypothetical protein GTU68_015277, partial [Idotea baltica]|nr:hypothetical protein [Idotea baltica]